MSKWTTVESFQLRKEITIMSERKYYITDFASEVYAAYETAQDQGLDNITLVIVCKSGEEYRINDTKDGFQCEDLDDFCWPILGALAATLYIKKMNEEKPVEIRVE